MKLSDFLSGVGRPVAYHPGLRKIAGSINATILLCQLFYWSDKTKDEDGWIYKRAEGDDEQSLETETGLSYKEQRVARRILREKKLLEEWNDREGHKLYFRVNYKVLNKLWEQLTDGQVVGEDTDNPTGKGHMPNGQEPDDQRAEGNIPSGISTNCPTGIPLSGNSETTQETTHHITEREDLSDPAFQAEEDHTQNSKAEEPEPFVEAVQKAFGDHVGSEETPVKELAGICEENSIPPGHLAIFCAMKCAEGDQRTILELAQDIAIAWREPSKKQNLLAQASFYFSAVKADVKQVKP